MHLIVRGMGLVAIVLACGAFIPVGSCAKGCGRVASHEADDIARLGMRSTTHASERIAVTGAHYADDLARTGSHVADDLARTGSHGGGIASELEQSGIRLSEQQHGEVIDALDIAKDVAEEVIGQLVDADTSDDDEAQVKLDKAAVQLQATLERTLTVEQQEAFRATFGTAKDVVDRLTADGVRKRASGGTQK